MASKKVSGITIAINADTSGVTSGLKELTDQSVSLSKQLKSVEALLDMDPGNTELMAQKQELLAKAAETSAAKLEALRAAQEDVKAAVASGSIGTDEYIAFQRELITTEKRLGDLQEQSDDTGEVMEELGDQTEDAGEEMQETAEESGRLGEKLKNGLAAGAKLAAEALAATTAAAAAAVAGIVKVTGETAEAGDKIDKASQKLGMSAESYQEWDAIMQHSGSDIDKMSGAMQKMLAAIESPTEKTSAAFEKLGISMEDASKMSQEELFSATITALQQMESGTERTVLANDLLGKSAMDLGALLNTSAEDTEAMRQKVHDLGGVMSGEAVKAAARYQDSLQDMKTAIGGIGKSIGASFLPSITQMMDGFTDLISGNEQGIETMEKGLDDFVQNVEKTADMISQAADTFLPLIINAITRNLPKIVDAAMKIVKKLVGGLMDNLPQLVSAAAEIIVTLAQGLADALPKLVPQVVGIITEIVNVLTKPSTLGALINAALDIITALIDGLLSQDTIDVLIKMLPQVMENLVDVLVKSVDKLLDAAIKIIEALCDYFLDSENLKKIIWAAGEILTSLGKALVDLQSKLGPFMLDLGKAWAEMFIGDIDYDATASDVLSRLGKAFVHNFFHSPEKLGEWVYDLFNSGEGAASESASGHWAVGGIFTAPTRAIIGENGAEAVLPLENHTGWMDILAQKIAENGGGGGLTVGSITVNVEGGENVGYEAVQKVDEALREYQIMMRRGTGGVSW